MLCILKKELFIMASKNSRMVSVIIPAHNAEKTLRQAIESVYHQGTDNFEIIIIDDGSTDHTAAICSELSASCGKIRVVHRKKAGGVSHARNLGIEMARGQYIAFLDSDDRLADNFLGYAINEIINNNLDVWIGTSIRLVDGVEKGRNEVWENFSGYGDEISEHQIIMSKWAMCPVYAKVFKRAAIGDIRLNENMEFAEDATFCWDVIFKQHIKYGMYRRIAYYYLFTGAGLASRISKKRYEGSVHLYHNRIAYGKQRKFPMDGEYFTDINNESQVQICV
jgi:glycosyltransferase involved in cell wall biosynthesis